MKIRDLEVVIENKRGSYKKFVDSLAEYPILGVTFPTDYGFINGYLSEDGHDLDIFVGSGELLGYLKMRRDEFPNGIETKVFIKVSEDELQGIKKEYGPVLAAIQTLPSEREFIDYITQFRK